MIDLCTHSLYTFVEIKARPPKSLPKLVSLSRPERVVFGMSFFPVINYLEEAPPDQVVQATLRVLGTYHEIQAERVSSLIHGFDEQYLQYLEETWKRLSFTHTSRLDALGSLTRIISSDMETYKSAMENSNQTETEEQSKTE